MARAGIPQETKGTTGRGKGVCSLEAAKHTAAATAAAAMLAGSVLEGARGCPPPGPAVTPAEPTGTAMGAEEVTQPASYHLRKTAYGDTSAAFARFNSRTVWLWRPSVWRCHSEVRFSQLLSEPRSPTSDARE